MTSSNHLFFKVPYEAIDHEIFHNIYLFHQWFWDLIIYNRLSDSLNEDHTCILGKASCSFKTYFWIYFFDFLVKLRVSLMNSRLNSACILSISALITYSSSWLRIGSTTERSEELSRLSLTSEMADWQSSFFKTFIRLTNPGLAGPLSAYNSPITWFLSGSGTFEEINWLFDLLPLLALALCLN